MYHKTQSNGIIGGNTIFVKAYWQKPLTFTMWQPYNLTANRAF